MTSSIRDKVLIAAEALYGYDPYTFDGMTLSDIWQFFSWHQLEHICDYCGIQ